MEDSHVDEEKKKPRDAELLLRIRTTTTPKSRLSAVIFDVVLKPNEKFVFIPQSMWSLRNVWLLRRCTRTSRSGSGRRGKASGFTAPCL